MSNQFDYELRANDQITGAIQRIDQAVTNLQPKLQKTADDLKLGGPETKDGVDDLSKKFTALARGAQQNVQYIGDMVPPLRNVTGFAGGVAGTAAKLGAIGAAGYVAVKGIEAAGSALSGIAGNAMQIDISAKNADMAVNDFTRLTGAYRLLGISSESAGQSIQGTYKTFNDALNGRNDSVKSLMNQINVAIATNQNGNADVTKTLQNLAEIFPSMAPGFQKTVTDTLGLDANTLMLMRDGVHYKELLAKAEQVGLTISPETNQKLLQFNRQLNEIGAAWDGLIQRSQQQIAMNIVDSPSMQRLMGDVENNLSNGLDNPSFLRMIHAISPEQESHVRRAMKTPDFWKTLTDYEQNWARQGIVVGDFKDKYESFFKDRPEQTESTQMHMRQWSPLKDNPAGSVNTNALSVRNNNPWNLRYVGQRGAVPGYGGFAQFASKDEGVKAADRQLMLYATGQSKNTPRPLNTVSDIVSVASPAWENNTPGMIQKISAELGVNPNQPLDLAHDQALRARFLTATFNQEGNNPYTSDQVQTIIAGDATTPSPLLTKPTLHPSLYAQNQNSTATVAAGANQQLSSNELTNAFTAALKEQGMKIELTVINSETGQRQTITGTGGHIAASMVY